MRINRRAFLEAGAAVSLAAAVGVPVPSAAPPGGDSADFFSLPDVSADGVIEFQAAPEKIVEGGLIRAGVFEAPPMDMNLVDSNSLGGKMTGPLGFSKMLQWVGAGMAHPEWYFGLIIIDARPVSYSVLYGYNRATGEYFSHDCVCPVKKARVAASMWDDTSSIRRRGFTMEVHHHLQRGIHEVKIDIGESGGNPAVAGDLTWHEDLESMQPLVRMSPQGGRYFIFNHKAQMPIEGTLRVGGREIVFDFVRDLANLDEVRSFAPEFSLNYCWFNCGGFDEGGRIVGLNIFHSEDRTDLLWTENCMWVGEKLFFLGPVRFEMDPEDISAPWRAMDEAGCVDIAFYPEGGKSIHLGRPVRYYQRCGTFQGTLIDGDGGRHDIADYYGCAEFAAVF